MAWSLAPEANGIVISTSPLPPTRGEQRFPGEPYTLSSDESVVVTLITGEVLEVTASETGETQINAVQGNAAGVQIYRKRGDKYVMPRGADLQRLDAELFNVDYLIRERFQVLIQFPLSVAGVSELKTQLVEA